MRRLLPAGQAFRGGEHLDAIIEALGLSLDRVHDFITAVQAESVPATADKVIDEWLAALGISISADSSLGDKRNIAAATYSSIGGQSLEYISGQVRAVFPNVTIKEIEEIGEFTFFYKVEGNIPYSRDFQKLFALLMRIAPLHLDPVYQVRPVYDGDVARCGIGSTGRAICGRSKTTIQTGGQ
jgi:hypothetical protein